MKRITQNEILAKIESLNKRFEFYTGKKDVFQYRSGYGCVGLDDNNGHNITGLMSKRELSMVIAGMASVLDCLPVPEFQYEKNH